MPKQIRATLATAALVAGLASAATIDSTPAFAATTFTLNSLAPVSTVTGIATNATLTLHSSACTTVKALTVAVRNSAGTNYDFPGAVNNVSICPSGYTLTTGSRTFPAGTYTSYGAYELNNTWYSLPSQSLNVGNAGTTSAPSWNPSGTYTATGDDEFNNSSVNTAIWEEGWYLGNGNTGVTAPVNSSEQDCYSSSNVSEPGDGYLHLGLTNTSSTCGGVTKPYTGSLVDTRTTFAQTGGSFEARVYLPPAGPNSTAGWPAVWLNGPDSTPWPQHGEIDVMEGLGGNTQAHLHYTDSTGTNQAPEFNDSGNYVGWHNFGEKWDSSAHTVTFYWDGRAIGTNAFPATLPEYLLLDYSIDSSSPRPAFPSTMLIDWVRVWK